MLKKAEKGNYVIERTFLGRVTVTEFMGNVIRLHGMEASRDTGGNGEDYEKNVEKSCGL